MRSARKVTLLAMTSIVAMVLVTMPAAATDPIEVIDEKTSFHCPELVSPHTSGGCVVHASGTIKLEVNFFGTWVEEDTCDVEFKGRLGHTGVGAIYDMDFYSAEAGTSTQECETETPVTMCDSPWEGSGEEAAAGTIHGVASVCIDSDETDICGSTLEFDIVESPGETYAINFDRHQIGALCRKTGSGQIETSESGNAAIHVNHL